MLARVASLQQPVKHYIGIIILSNMKDRCMNGKKIMKDRLGMGVQCSSSSADSMHVRLVPEVPVLRIIVVVCAVPYRLMILATWCPGNINMIARHKSNLLCSLIVNQWTHNNCNYYYVLHPSFIQHNGDIPLPIAETFCLSWSQQRASVNCLVDNAETFH